MGLGGRTGTIFGQTTPSLNGDRVIGTPTNDYAVNVFFEDLEGEYWFAEELLELIDRGQGMQTEIQGQRYMLDESGDWKPIA